MTPKDAYDPTPKITLPIASTPFYIGTTQVGNFRVDTSSNLYFTPTGGTEQGPWTLSLNVNSGSIGNSTINMVVGSTTYDSISGNIADNGNNTQGNGSGTLHQKDNITATDASWSTDGTSPR